MIYVTGDIHGNPRPVILFAEKMKLTADDTVVLLGDVGVNFDRNYRDERSKNLLNSLPCTVFCIHGNHEIRPQNIPGYEETFWNGGKVFVEPKWPKLLFAKDGEIFSLAGRRCLVIGGAYSVDKDYRLEHGYGWWPDEQPSEETKRYVESQTAANHIDIILSHTCPFKYEPREMFLNAVDQNTVDDSTERWLDKIEESVHYDAWYCGHWHTNKRIGKMHFLYDGWEMLGEETAILQTYSR